jgi:transmembrane sensor
MDQFYFYQLIDKYLDGTASEEERRFVEACYEALSGQDGKALSAGQSSDLRERLYKGVLAGGGLAAGISPEEKTIFAGRRLWPGRRMAVAAVLLALLGTFCWFILLRKRPGPDIISLSRIERYRNDVAPAHQGVTLTLANGVQILLDSAANGHLAVQGVTQVVKQDSTLSYIPGMNEGKSPGPGVSRETTGRLPDGGLFYNTVATGKGHIFQLRLPDGTGVWLDALSSIRFPTSFPGQERVVTVTGQAYFEVTRDKRRPFRVVMGDQTVEVLGTHFNINGYGPVIKTTLLEGAVRVSAGGSHSVLSPGEQAQSGAEEGVRVTDGADLDEAVAWKNGRFRFNGSSIEEIMKQAARWYDIDVVYHDRIPETFVAKISRNVPISRLLDLLEMTQQVAFTVEGNKVTVWSRHGKKG